MLPFFNDMIVLEKLKALFDWLLPLLDGFWGFFGLLVAVLIYYTQTVFTKRISWCHFECGKHSWIILFNGSKKILISDDIYKNKKLSINVCNVQGYEIIGSSRVEDAKLNPIGNDLYVDSQHMDPKAFLIIEFLSFFAVVFYKATILLKTIDIPCDCAKQIIIPLIFGLSIGGIVLGCFSQFRRIPYIAFTGAKRLVRKRIRFFYYGL